jgi:hypothetical protein
MIIILNKNARFFIMREKKNIYEYSLKINWRSGMAFIETV